MMLNSTSADNSIARRDNVVRSYGNKFRRINNKLWALSYLHNFSILLVIIKSIIYQACNVNDARETLRYASQERSHFKGGLIWPPRRATATLLFSYGTTG